MPRAGLTALALAAGLAFAPDARSDDPPPHEEIVVRGLRTGVLPHDPSSFASEVRPSDFEGERRSLEDLLSSSVGVQVRRFGGPGERAEASIRGSTSSQVVILLDGVRMNSEQSGAVDLSSFPVELIERIEIARGGGSVEYGSGAIGGSINIVTRSGTAAPTTRASFSGGSWNTFQGSLFHGRTWGPIEASLGYDGFATDGDYEFARPERRFSDGTTIASTSAVRLNNERQRHSLELGAGGAVSQAGRLRLRESLLYASGGEPGLDSAGGPTAGQQPFAHGRDFRSVSQLQWNGADPLPWEAELDGSLYYRFERTTFSDPLPGLLADPIDVRQDLWTLGLTGDDAWRRDLELAGRAVGSELRVGLDARWDALRPREDPDRDRASVAVSASEQLSLFDARLVASLALRVDWTEGFPVEWLPHFGLVVAPTPWLHFKGNVERAFRSPNFDELYFPDKGFIRGNPDLRPEESFDADVGFELLFDEVGWLGEVSASSAFFYDAIDESIVWLLVSNSVVEPRNTGPATLFGTESSLAITPTAWLALSANHTWVHARRDASGDPLPGRPEQEVNARLELKARRWAKLVTELHYTDVIPVSTGGAAQIEPQLRVDASASVDLASLPPLAGRGWLETLWLVLRVDNVADVSLRDARFFPRPGRSVTLGFEAKR